MPVGLIQGRLRVDIITDQEGLLGTNKGYSGVMDCWGLLGLIGMPRLLWGRLVLNIGIYELLANRKA